MQSFIILPAEETQVFFSFFKIKEQNQKESNPVRGMPSDFPWKLWPTCPCLIGGALSWRRRTLGKPSCWFFSAKAWVTFTNQSADSIILRPSRNSTKTMLCASSDTAAMTSAPQQRASAVTRSLPPVGSCSSDCASSSGLYWKRHVSFSVPTLQINASGP